MTVVPNISSELTKAALKTFDFFQAERLTFALAESCTGGLCAAAFTEIPGVSSRFLCGYIVYSNEAKQRDLGVSKETLTRFGAVSSETVSEMLKGLRQKTGCAVAGAVSGIAGPGGGTPEKPVGTVFIGTANACGEKISRFLFQGDREEIRRQAALTLIRMLAE